MAENYTRRINIWINGKQVKNEIADIKNAMTKLINEQARMTIGSNKYNESTQKIRYLKGIIDQHNASLKGTAAGWQQITKMAQSINKYFLLVSSFVAGFTGTIMAGKKAIGMYAEFDDKVANVSRTTGMATEDIYKMNDSLKKVDTRTAQIDLMQLGVIAGKLGVATDEVEGFIRSADKINVALSGALGPDTEEAINQIGKLVNIFKIDKDFGLEQGMLKVASSINSLGNASTANEGYIVEFAKRVAGIAPTVDISIDKVLGLAATLDQLGQTSEVSSTVYSQMMTGMFKKTATYAGIAGMSLKAFKDLLAKDTNEAFIKVLEGLNGNNAGMEKLVGLMGDIGLDGKRAVQVIGVLSNNTQLLRQQQELANKEYEKGDSILVAFNKRNESAQAKLEKARKILNNLAIDLGKKLMPAMTTSTSAFSYLVKAISATIDFFFQYYKIIIPTVAALGTYVVALRGAKLIEELRNIELKKGLIISNLQAVAIRTQIMLTGEATMAQKRALVETRSLNAAMKTNIWALAISAVVMAGMAIYEYTKKVSAAVKAENEHNKRLVETSIEVDKEKSAIDRLVKVAKDEKRSKDDRITAINELKRISGGYLEGLTLENIKTEEGRKLLNKYNKELENSIWLKANKDEMTKSVNRQIEIKHARFGVGNIGGTYTEAQKAKVERDKYNPLTDAKVYEHFDQIYQKAQEKDNAQVNEYNALMGTRIALTREYYDLINQRNTFGLTGTNNDGDGGGGGGGDGEPPSLKDIEQVYKDRIKMEKEYRESEINLMQEGYKKDLYQLHASYVEKREETLHELQTNKKLTTDDKEILNATLLNLDRKYVADVDKLSNEYQTKQLEFRKNLIDLQLEGVKEGSDEEYALKKQSLYNEMNLEISKVTGTEVEKQQLITAIRAKYARKQSELDEKQSIKFLDDKLKQEIKTLTEGEEEKLRKLKSKRDRGEISQREYNKELLSIQKQFTVDSLQLSIKKAERELEILKASGEDTIQAEQTLAELRLKLQQELTGKEPGSTTSAGAKGLSEMTDNEKLSYAVEQAEKIASAVFEIQKNAAQAELDHKLSMLEKEKEAELNNVNLSEAQKAAIQEKYDTKARRLKQEAFRKQRAADLIQATINGALAITKTFAEYGFTPAAIAASIAQGISTMAQIAVIASQPVPEYSEGGFTGSGGKYQIAGVVHKKEYVVPEEGTSNPDVRRVLDVFELNRQQGNLPRLRTKDIIDSISSTGYVKGGYSSNSTGKASKTSIVTNSTTVNDNGLLVVMLQRLMERLESPIEASVALRGRKGLYDIMNEDETLKNNASL